MEGDSSCTRLHAMQGCILEPQGCHTSIFVLGTHPFFFSFGLSLLHAAAEGIGRRARHIHLSWNLSFLLVPSLLRLFPAHVSFASPSFHHVLAFLFPGYSIVSFVRIRRSQFQLRVHALLRSVFRIRNAPICASFRVFHVQVSSVVSSPRRRCRSQRRTCVASTSKERSTTTSMATNDATSDEDSHRTPASKHGTS